jgi:hypothetical protein
MRKVKVFEDFFEVYDDGILTQRLPLTTDQYSTIELHIGSLEPIPDIVANGNVPQEVTMRQAKLALLQYGLLQQVDTAIANMPGVQGQAARIEWEYAATVKRNAPLLGQIASAFGLTDEQLDNLFILAATFD